MGMVPILLLLAACQSAFSAGNSSGQDFVVVFPENIAYYYPASNRLLITALYSGTQVLITRGFSQIYVDSRTLYGGSVVPFYIGLQVNRANLSDYVFHITSTNDITVFAVTSLMDSTQTFQIPPVDSLGTEYYIPVLPPRVTAGSPVPTSLPAPPWQFTDPSSSPFRLLVVNTGTQNQVSVVGSQTVSVSLPPFQVAQLFMDQSHTLVKVSAQEPVLVLLSHPCFPRSNCSCSMLVTPLSPSLAWGKSYLLPPALGDSNTALMLTSDMPFSINGTLVPAASLQSFYPGWLTTNRSMSPILYQSGRLFSLIPAQQGSACFMIHSDSWVGRTSLVVLPSNQTAPGLARMNDQPLQATWQAIAGTDCSWALVPLTLDKAVVWHTSSQMAVYFLGELGTGVYGNPAISISRLQDYRGCVLTPENLTVGDDQVSWTDAVQYCRNLGLELISFGDDQLQQQLTPTLMNSLKEKGSKLWIGLRRSSLTGDWYWLNKAPLGTTLWEDGEPGGQLEGQCAMMGLGPKNQLSWSDQSCCEEAHPVCYKDPLLFNMNQM